MRVSGVVASVVLMGTVAACGGGGGGPAQPTAPADDSFAAFGLRGAGYSSDLRYTNAGTGLVFCRRQANYLWVRFAADRAADGANAPHIDIDLCRYSGSGRYAVPHDVSTGLSCSQGMTWDVWWHDGAKVFVSRPSSAPCEITLTAAGGALDGTFQCAGLTPQAGGADRLDVSGSFRCATVN